MLLFADMESLILAIVNAVLAFLYVVVGAVATYYMAKLKQGQERAEAQREQAAAQRAEVKEELHKNTVNQTGKIDSLIARIEENTKPEGRS